MALKTYDPKKVIITWGTLVVTGYMKDSFLKIGRMSDQFTSEAGASGEVARALNADRRGTMEVTLIQTSKTNDDFSTQMIIDENTGDGSLPLLVTDLRGTSLYAAEHAWIKKYADGTFAQGIEGRQWTFETDELEVFVGGVTAAP